jgi:DNA-binding transcriptional MerR regulator
MYYTIDQACRALHVNPRTLHKWLAETGITPETPPQDKRVQRLTQDQLDTLARRYERTLRPAESIEDLRAERDALLMECDRLRAQLSAAQERIRELTPQARPRTSLAHIAAAPANDLPEGWVNAISFLMDITHRSESSARRDLNGFEHHAGKWGNIKYAFDPDQQQAVRAHFGLG